MQSHWVQLQTTSWLSAFTAPPTHTHTQGVITSHPQHHAACIQFGLSGTCGAKMCVCEMVVVVRGVFAFRETEAAKRVVVVQPGE